MAFKKGDPKPVNSGMKKGQQTKKTIWLRETLDSVDFVWEEKLATAYAENDYKKIELLQQLIPYLNPKIKDKEPESDPPSSEETVTDILSIVSKPNE